MPLPGGPADKFGNRYEHWWTVLQLVRVIDGQATSIRIEDPTVDKAEFVLTAGDHRELHQAKRSHTDGKWSLSSLGRDGLLQTMFDQLSKNLDARFVFVSGSDAPELRELTERARSAKNLEEFEAEFINAEAQEEALGKLKSFWHNTDTSTAYEILQRIEVRTIDERGLEEQVRAALWTQFSPTQPDDVCDALRSIVEDSIHKTIDREFLISTLQGREFPSLGRWMAKKLGLSTSLGGLSTPREHWESICEEKAAGDPPLPPKLFTEGRDDACNGLQAIFEGKQRKLLLFAESPQDVEDFVAAYIQTLDVATARDHSNRCLYIREEDAWRSVVESRQSHVLVSAVGLALESEERSDLLTLATRKGHAVVIPLCGAWSSGSPEIVKLRSPSQYQIETVLRESGYSNARARKLASVGGDRLSALRRYLQGLGPLPSYATWENARLIAQAGLAGKWDGTSPADRSALEKLLGKGYGEWIETLRPDVLRSDTPLIQRDEKWRMVARGEAWNALGNRIIDEDLERLREVAVSVLGERDPKFDLPKEERFLANVRGKQLKHSSRLREGLTETLALVGSRPEVLSSCSSGKAETTVILVVRQLLYQASWERWASLGSLLPLLAEAAPGEFLDAVEAALVNLNQSPFHDVFSQEGNGGIADWNYMSGLLWALETLAWNPDYLSRVAVILADLSSIDPGGNWANRPANSLVGVFLPWHVQTTASFDKRKTAIETVLHEHPHVGWKLLLALLPHEHGLVIEGPRPTWRDYIPRDWKDSVLVTEYWDQVAAYTDLAVGLAKESPEKLGELVDHLPEISEPARASVLKHLASEQIVNLSESERFPLWEKISDLVRHHRKFADAAWALPTETLAEIEETANALAPETFELKKKYLFDGQGLDLYDGRGTYEEQRKRLDEERQTVIQTILERGGLRAVLTFGRTVRSRRQSEQPWGS